jgi:uncharacterized protein
MFRPQLTAASRFIAAALALVIAASTAAAPPGAGQASAPRPAIKARMIDWDQLLPASERAHFFTQAPPPVHDYLGERGRAARQAGSVAVNRKLAETQVKIPGFVVPVVIDKMGVIRAFFLVPYLGSCIHVPPPPPNQLVYVKLTGGGVRIDSLEQPFWVTGTLHTTSEVTQLATAAYTLDASQMELYSYQ